MTKFGIRPEAAPTFLQLLRAVTETTPCVVDPSPFTSEHRRDREEAAEACRWCPARGPCEAYAAVQDEQHHVWAGVDRTPQPKPKTKEAA